MNTGSILIVDDEPQIRRVLRSGLTKQGYAVGDAGSAQEALDKLRLERYDLALVDRNMPGTDGVELCRSIRAGSDIGIIMLTVRKAEADKIEALDAGADDYVTKPFSMPELLARIRANLRRPPLASQEGPAVVAFEGIELNLGARRLAVEGRDVRLTPKEFDVLRFLMANPDVVMPHSRILQAIWGPEYSGQVEYLHVFINQIRKKIEPDPAKPRYIVTEPWVGYRFQSPPRKQ